MLFQVCLQLLPWLDWNAKDQGKLQKGEQISIFPLFALLSLWHYDIMTFWHFVIMTLWSHYSWSYLNSHARWCSWVATTWQCRLCWTSSPPRTWCRRPPGSSTASPQSCLILGWEKTICRGWFEICFRNTSPSLETTWKLTTFLEDYFLRRLPP